MSGHGSSLSGVSDGLEVWPLLSAHSSPVGAGAQLFAEDGLIGALLTGRAFDPRAVFRRDFGRFVDPVEDVPGLDILPRSSSDSGLATKHENGFGKGFLGGHKDSHCSKLVCILCANLLASNPGKMFCMENLGQLVQRWREKANLKPGDLAAMVRKVAVTEEGSKVERQHIEQLEKVGKRQPRYIDDLARAMGCTVDDLYALRMPPIPGQEGEPPSPGGNFDDRREVSESDWATLNAVKTLIPEDDLADMRARYAELERKVREDIAATSRGKPRTFAGTTDTTMVPSPSEADKGNKGAGGSKK